MASTNTATGPRLNGSSLGIPALVIIMIVMMVIPLPPFSLDILFTFNIAFSLTVLLAAIYTKRPLNFSVFPTVILVATLMRLSLNIASTRVVLLNGHTGTGAAGHVVQAFGEVVIGGSYTVGLVVFAILVIINFVVVTKGATRISEVTARFTLDAMPGKQMAIDADLNAGVLSQEEAKKKREDVTQEADFYGSMDGASKFVRGDAIAGLLILFINILGGIIIGITQYDMGLKEASQNYVILTIGDGLVAQIPSLLLSTAAAIIVTRVNSEQDVGRQISGQLFDNPRVLSITAIVIGVLGIIPGMPHFAFLSMAAVAGFGGILLKRRKEVNATKKAAEIVEKPPAEDLEELSWNDVSPVDLLSLEIGYKLINLVDKKQNGQLMGRIKGVRKKLSQELGFLISAVHIRDNLEIPPNKYVISLKGVAYGQANIEPDKFLAINPGEVFGSLPGIHCKDPAFGLAAVWVLPEEQDYARSLGYTVVDPSTVIATHLNHIVEQHASELLGHEEVQQLIDKLAKSSSKLAEALTPDGLPLSTIVKVLQNLLKEQIPITDMRTIAQTLIETSIKNKEVEVLTSATRIALKRLIIQRINGENEEVDAIVLAPELEQILQQSIQTSQESSMGLEPSVAEKLFKSLSEYEQRKSIEDKPAILVVSPVLREEIAKFVKHSIPGLHVLSFQEIPDDKQLKITSVVGNNQ